MTILGLSAFYHDSAAALIVDGQIIAACQEERFSRRKHDPDFPEQAINYCLQEAGISLDDVDYICFYEKPFIKFERLLETYLSYAPFKGFFSYWKAMPTWLQYKLNLKSHLKKKFKQIESDGISEKTKLLFNTHHLSHAGSAYYPSPFSSAAILCVDGVGEWETTSTWKANKNNIEPLGRINFPHSLGLLYSAFTYFCGFKVNSGEYKLMGLAPYGEPKYTDVILKELIHVQEDGSYKLNMNYFCYPVKDYMVDEKFEKLFSIPIRKPEGPMPQVYKDIAASVQKVLELVLVRMAKKLKETTGEENLCLAGGVALNCVANSKILQGSGFKNIWVQPAAGDAGGALGAALTVWHSYLNHPKGNADQMNGCYLGPSFTRETTKSALDRLGAKYRELSDRELLPLLAEKLSDGKTLGWFQGRMEYGPRALGARSILADARKSSMQNELNLKIKFRESFRPFAPVTLRDKKEESFELVGDSPYMMFTGQVKTKSLPAVTHKDGSARLQTVTKESNPRLYQLLDTFREKTGCATLINTSFNVRGEPIVHSPEDAYHCFMNTYLDNLVIDNFYLCKTDQPTNLDLPKIDFEKD